MSGGVWPKGPCHLSEEERWEVRESERTPPPEVFNFRESIPQQMQYTDWVTHKPGSERLGRRKSMTKKQDGGLLVARRVETKKNW